MLRINLLPPYIYDRKKKVWVAAAWGGVCLAVIGAGMYFYSNASAELATEKTNLQTATNLQSEYNANDTKIKDINTKIADTMNKQTFIANAQKYNDSWPRVYSSMRDVTSPTILLEDLSIDPGNHKQLKFTGFANSELIIARWWLALRNAQDRFDNVFINLPTHPYEPKSAGASTTGNPYGGMSGYPGGFGGSGKMGGGGPTMGSMSGLSNSGGGIVPNSGSGMPGGMPPGYGGGTGRSGSGANTAVGPTVINGRHGINFTGTALVKEALAPPAVAPTWPSTAAPAGPAAGAGVAGRPAAGGGRPAAAAPASGGGAKADKGDE